MAILISALGAGGAERVIAQLAQHCLTRGYSISVITFDSEHDPIYHDLPSEVQLRRLNCPGGGLRGNVQRMIKLRTALASAKPDLLISFLTKNNLLASLAKTGLGLKWIACERNNPERQNAHPAWSRLLTIAYRHADAIVCQTNGVRRCFPAAVQDRVTLIPNPIVSRTAKAKASGKRIAAVGRLDRQKGFDCLIDGFSLIAPNHPEWVLDIWGSGPEHSALQEQIMQQGMTDRITLRGTSNQPGGWVDETDLFVLSSRYEGFPNVLGEALAAGLPVIATDCDFGPSDMVTHGLNGWLVNVGSPSALGKALDKLIADEPLRRRLGDAAPAAALPFAPEHVMKKWDGLIDQLTNSSRAARMRGSGPHQAHPAE